MPPASSIAAASASCAGTEPSGSSRPATSSTGRVRRAATSATEPVLEARYASESMRAEAKPEKWRRCWSWVYARTSLSLVRVMASVVTHTTGGAPSSSRAGRSGRRAATS